MKATDVRVHDERWAFGHPLFEVVSLRNDNLHVHARCYWYAFDTYDTVSWHVEQDVPGIVRIAQPTAHIADPFVAVPVVDAREPATRTVAGSQLGRLLSWMS